MNRLLIAVFITWVIVLFLSIAAYAGSTNDPWIQKREIRQERRINRGVWSRALTPRETRRLEAEQAKIRQDEMRFKSDGRLTMRERAKLTREQNRASRDIFRLKHNRRRV